jgi:hypothetical protein
VVLSGRVPDRLLPRQGNRRQTRDRVLLLLLCKENRPTHTAFEAHAAKPLPALLLHREFHLGTRPQDPNERLRRDPSLAGNRDHRAIIAERERLDPGSSLFSPSDSSPALRLAVLIRAH